jgi:hypothetical protein
MASTGRAERVVRILTVLRAPSARAAEERLLA